MHDSIGKHSAILWTSSLRCQTLKHSSDDRSLRGNSYRQQQTDCEILDQVSSCWPVQERWFALELKFSSSFPYFSPVFIQFFPVFVFVATFHAKTVAKLGNSSKLLDSAQVLHKISSCFARVLQCFMVFPQVFLDFSCFFFMILQLLPGFLQIFLDFLRQFFQLSGNLQLFSKFFGRLT